MKLFDVQWDCEALNILNMTRGLDEGKKILLRKTDFIEARTKDLEGELYSGSGKKRKWNGDLCSWVTKGQKLVHEARSLLGHDGSETCTGGKRSVEEWIMYFPKTCLKLAFIHKMVKALSDLEKEADMLRRRTLPDTQGPDHINLIPVKTLFGHAASDAMEQLTALLQGDATGRIAICGIEGIGKTFLMKHLHNSVVKWAEKFDYIFWVTSPGVFSIESVQDAIASAVDCDLSCVDSVSKGAEMLSNTLAGLGNFVLFLDDVPEVDFSLVQIGIDIPAEESKSKLVLTTRSNVVPEMLDCHKILKLQPFSDEEAWQFFMKEARISKKSAGLGGSTNTPKLLAKECCGVPGKIVEIGSRMRDIDDPCEWRNVLFEVRKS